MGAAVIIYAGTKVGQKADGYWYPVAAVTGFKHFCTALETVDNSAGSAGDKTIAVQFEQPKYLLRWLNDTGSPVTAAMIGGDAYGLDNQTATASSSGGTRSRLGTVWDVIGSSDPIGDRPGVWIEPDTPNTTAAAAALAALPATAVQGGTATLVAGVATISTATITASSRIIVSMKDPGSGAITGLGALKAPDADRTVGAPGSFKVYAIDDSKATITTAVSTFDWLVINL
jgi:hypothetical protein